MIFYFLYWSSKHVNFTLAFDVRFNLVVCVVYIYISIPIYTSSSLSTSLCGCGCFYLVRRPMSSESNKVKSKNSLHTPETRRRSVPIQEPFFTPSRRASAISPIKPQGHTSLYTSIHM